MIAQNADALTIAVIITLSLLAAATWAVVLRRWSKRRSKPQARARGFLTAENAEMTERARRTNP